MAAKRRGVDADKRSESDALKELLGEYRRGRDTALDDLEARAKLLRDSPTKLSKGVRDSLYREVSEATKAAYRKKAYKPKKASRYRKKLQAARKEIVEDALRSAGGNVARAARHLEVDPDTIYEAISAS